MSAATNRPAEPWASAEAAGCPLCGKALEDVPILTSRDRLFDRPGEFAIVECAECRLGVTRPRLEGSELAAHYPPAYPSWRFRGSAALARLKARRTVTTSALGPYGRFLRQRRGAVLDVGLGRGDLAVAFAGRGWRAFGLDISREAVAEARSRGIDARVAEIQEAPWPDGTFDLVVMSHVLEHLADPVGSLACARRLLRPGGGLIVAVPNWDSWQRRLFGSRWVHLDTPRHLQHFSPQALRVAAERAGFAGGRIRRNVSAVGLAVSLQYLLFGRWVVSGPAREALLAAGFLLYPVSWLVGRPLGGDCIYLVTRAPEGRS